MYSRLFSNVSVFKVARRRQYSFRDVGSTFTGSQKHTAFVFQPKAAWQINSSIAGFALSQSLKAYSSSKWFSYVSNDYCRLAHMLLPSSQFFSQTGKHHLLRCCPKYFPRLVGYPFMYEMHQCMSVVQNILGSENFCFLGIIEFLSSSCLRSWMNEL